LLIKKAFWDIGSKGYDKEYGFGIMKLSKLLKEEEKPEIKRLYSVNIEADMISKETDIIELEKQVRDLVDKSFIINNISFQTKISRI